MPRLARRPAPFIRAAIGNSQGPRARAKQLPASASLVPSPAPEPPRRRAARRTHGGTAFTAARAIALASPGRSGQSPGFGSRASVAVRAGACTVPVVSPVVRPLFFTAMPTVAATGPDTEPTSRMSPFVFTSPAMVAAMAQSTTFA